LYTALSRIQAQHYGMVRFNKFDITKKKHNLQRVVELNVIEKLEQSGGVPYSHKGK
jgi:hypothetical protein